LDKQENIFEFLKHKKNEEIYQPGTPRRKVELSSISSTLQTKNKTLYKLQFNQSINRLGSGDAHQTSTPTEDWHYGAFA
jgi:hypothetical protein